MTGGLWPSAFVAAVFAIHPLRVESVAWVSERKDVLSGLFFMLTLGAYVGYVRRPFSLARYLPVVVLFALGLMAKPMLVTLPFVLLLLDYWPLGRIVAGHSVAPPRVRACWLVRKSSRLLGAGGGFLRGDARWPRRRPSQRLDGSSPPSGGGQRPGFLRGLPGPVLLSGGAGRLLSPSGNRLPLWKVLGAVAAAGGRLRRRPWRCGGGAPTCWSAGCGIWGCWCR